MNKPFYTTENPQTPHMVFFGRFCPLHQGHIWLINQKRKENPDLPVLILIRDTSFDEFSAEIRSKLVESWMRHNNIRGTIRIIEDIEGVYYGRGVGYNVEESKPPENIKVVSATRIREMMKNNDATWKEIVAPGTVEYLQKIISP